MKILIVDDSVFMRNMIKNALDQTQHEIKEAANFDEAIATFSEFKPDLTFLDIILPGKSGVEILKAIKEIDNAAKVTMCTSIGGQQEIINEAISAGASDVIVKPFKKEDISNIVANLGNSAPQ